MAFLRLQWIRKNQKTCFSWQKPLVFLGCFALQRGGNAQLAAALDGLEVVAGEDDADALSLKPLRAMVEGLVFASTFLF